MKCSECGAGLPEGESCLDRFYTFLAAEWEHPEAAEMHGLLVLAYHAQHPSLCQPWIRASHAETLREIYRKGRPWREVLSWPSSRSRRQRAVDQLKERLADAPGSLAFGHPIAGEMTVGDLPAPGSPFYPSGYPSQVEAWAASVAQKRFL